MSENPSDNLDLLIQKAKSGDADSIAAVLEDCAEQVAGRVRPRIGAVWQSLLSVEDVMQITFVESFQQFGRFEGNDRRSVIAWLTKIAMNNLQDAIRGLERDKRPSPKKRQHAAVTDETYVTLVEQMGADTTTISSKAARKELQRLLEASLQKLPADYATAIRLYDLQNMSGPEVSEQMGRSRGAVHMLRSRGLEQLRKQLGAATNFFTHGD